MHLGVGDPTLYYACVWYVACTPYGTTIYYYYDGTTTITANLGGSAGLGFGAWGLGVFSTYVPHAAMCF